MYTVTSPEPIEFRIRKMELKVTENCLFDNIQLYDGHKELGWICQAKNKFLNWTKVDSGDLAVYFEGYSGKHYGFDLEWRSQIKTTKATTTTTTTTTTTRTTRTTRRRKYMKKHKNKKRNQVGFIETVKRRYEFLIKRREQTGGNSILQSRIIEKFNKMVNHVFANQNRKQMLRPCYLPQGGSLENSKIPPLFRNQISSATTSTKIMSVLTAIISRQDQLCRKTSRRRMSHPKRWLQWFDNRSTRLKQKETKNFM
jgi:hypothetical protein